MNRVIISAALLLMSFSIMAQEDSTKNLGEVIVYANKFAEKKKNLAQKIDVINSKMIAQVNTQNTGDLLISTGNIFVQKSQQGGSSPVLRGFEASRVLLVVDGIRMNNAIYRSGHLQNIITIDQNMLESVEILYGPSSTIYGSDALGGVVSFRTKSPKFSSTNKVLTTGNLFGRYSSANNEKTTHFDLSVGGKKFAWLQSYTYSNFGDMKLGSNYPDKYPNFGRRDSLVSTEGGVDKVVFNTNKNIQKFSGYKQWDITQKFVYKQSDKISHQLNLQLSNSNNVPRYDRLQDKKNFGGTTGTTLRYAEWYYGPQKRNLASYQLAILKTSFADEISANINYQDIVESRQTREFKRYDRFDSRKEHLKIWGFNIDARKKWNKNELTYGTDGQFNNLKSVATRTNQLTGIVSSLDTRFPNGKNNMNYFGLFAQHIYKIKKDILLLNDGLRLQFVSLHSTIADNSFFNLPYTSIDQNNVAVTGNLGLVYLAEKDLRLTVNLASGFRAPNIDDLSKIFESSTSAKQIVVSNPDIKPERTYNIELGMNKSFAGKVTFELTGFYTFFRNAIVKAPFQLNGNDSILYNGVMSQVLANQNRNNAYVAGFNSNISINFSDQFTFYSALTYTYGRYKKFTGEKVPLDHIPPFYGKSGISFKEDKFNAELFTLYNGWKKLKDYNPDGEDNQQYATADGMPSWITFNWRGNYNITPKTQIQFAVENIFDRNYRYFASGFSAPGRNFVIAVRAAF